MALVAAEPGEARGGAQFPELGPLLLGDAQSLAIEFLGGLSILLAALTPASAAGSTRPAPQARPLCIRP